MKVSTIAVANRRLEHLQDIIDLDPEEIKEIQNPLFQAIALALLEGRTSGNWYRVRHNPKIQDFEFAFLGFSGKPQLNREGLWLKSCRTCGKKISILILRRTLHLRSLAPNRIEQYEEKTEHPTSRFTLECGKVYLDGFLTAEDLMREKIFHGKTPNAQKEAFLDIKSIKKSLFLISHSKIRRIGQ